MDLLWTFREPRGNSGQGQSVGSETMPVLNAHRNWAGPLPELRGPLGGALGAHVRVVQEEDMDLPMSSTLEPQMQSHGLFFSFGI